MSFPLFEIASEFNIKGTIEKIESYGNGLINDTFKIFINEEKFPDYILQRKNHKVFKDIEGMMENIVRITSHIQKKLELQGIKAPQSRIITHIQTKKGEYYHKDSDGNFWTVFLFIPGSKVLEKIESPEHAFLAGKAFGEFQKQLTDFPGKSLNETIANFHNIESRYQNFKNALALNHQNRASSVQNEINFVWKHKEEMHTLIHAQKKGDIPLRTTHNDTKINNVLFDQDGKILCVIDLDTVMPGLIHFDFGDAIRTAASTADEDETDLDKITIDLELFEGFTHGFLNETKTFLTEKEIQLLPHSVKFMTFIMGLRFLTDYLEGDVYYKIKYPDHNLDRARAQFQLVSEISKKEKEMGLIIKKMIL